MNRKWHKLVHLLFCLFLAVNLLPDKGQPDEYRFYLIGFAAILEIIVLLTGRFASGKTSDTVADVISAIYVLLIVWTLATVKLGLLRPALFPPFGKVIWQIIDDREELLSHIGCSVSSILEGYFLALVSALLLGLFISASYRLRNSFVYINKFFASIPPVVYVPYGIALLPTLRSVSIFVIFLAGFWPIFGATISGVSNIDREIIDSARALDVSGRKMLFRILLPAALPEIFFGCMQGLSMSFIMLTAAEMVGGRQGLGYYVKSYSMLGDYTRTIGGVLMIGIVVVLITFVFNSVKKRFIRWK